MPLMAKPSVIIPKTITVSTTEVKAMSWQHPIDAIGTLSAYKGTMIHAEASGRVIKIYFKSGQWVKQGQLLIQLYPDIINAQLTKAIANQKFAKQTYQRQQQLANQGFISHQQLDESKNNLVSSTAEIHQLQAQQRLLTIRAPFSGKLGLNQVSIGQYLSVGLPIVDLECLDPIRVEFYLPAKDRSQFHLGDKVILQTLSDPHHQIIGKTYAINSAIDPNTRMIAIRANVANHDHILLPGDFVSVKLYHQPQKIVVIPATAIGYSPSGNYVYRLIAGDTVVKTPITIGKELTHNRIIIQQGLKPGETIVINVEQLNLKSGAKVTVAHTADLLSDIAIDHHESLDHTR